MSEESEATLLADMLEVILDTEDEELISEVDKYLEAVSKSIVGEGPEVDDVEFLTRVHNLFRKRGIDRLRRAWREKK